MSKIKSIISITRLNKPIGIYLLLYPSLISFTFAYQDYLNGSSGQLIEIPSYPLLIIICGCILVRSTGCVINDIFDYKFDKLVERTKDRPLANGNFTHSVEHVHDHVAVHEQDGRSDHPQRWRATGRQPQPAPRRLRFCGEQRETRRSQPVHKHAQRVP